MPDSLPDSSANGVGTAVVGTAVKEGFDLDEATQSLIESSEIVRRTLAALRKARELSPSATQVRFQG